MKTKTSFLKKKRKKKEYVTSKSLSPSQQREEEAVCFENKGACTDTQWLRNISGIKRDMRVLCKLLLVWFDGGETKKILVRRTLTCRSDTFPSFSQLPKTHWGFPVLLSSLCHFSSGCLSFSLTNTHTPPPPPPPRHHSWLPSLWSPPHTPEPPVYHHPTPRETMALSSRLKLWEQKGGAVFRACGSDWASCVLRCNLTWMTR